VQRQIVGIERAYSRALDRIGGQLLWASEMLDESFEREVAEPRGTLSGAKLEVRNLIPIDDSIWRHPTRIRATGLDLFDELAVQIIDGFRVTHLADVVNPPELPPIKRLLRFREVNRQALSQLTKLDPRGDVQGVKARNRFTQQPIDRHSSDSPDEVLLDVEAEILGRGIATRLNSALHALSVQARLVDAAYLARVYRVQRREEAKTLFDRLKI
jgi:hypothetical protein